MSEMITASECSKIYGLTPKEIRELGEPDAIVANPYYPNGPRVKLYDDDRVHRFWEARSRDPMRARRKAAAAKAAATKQRRGADQ